MHKLPGQKQDSGGKNQQQTCLRQMQKILEDSGRF